MPSSYSDPGAIEVLEGLEAVRRRPGMYLGDIKDRGLQRWLSIALDAAVDGAEAGCVKVEVTLGRDGSITVFDTGRAIPPEHLEAAFYELHACRCRRSTCGHADVAYAILAALSEHLTADVWDRGEQWRFAMERGVAVGPPMRVEPLGQKPVPAIEAVCLRMTPDRSIFADAGPLDTNWLRKRLCELAALHAGLAIRLKDETTGRDFTYDYPRGLGEWAAELAGPRAVLHEPIGVTEEFEGGHVRLALTWLAAGQDGTQLLSFANDSPTPEGGTYVRATLDALQEALFLTPSSLRKPGGAPSTSQLGRGLVAVVAVGLEGHRWVRPGLDHLDCPEIEAPLRQALVRQLRRAFSRRPADATALATRILASPTLARTPEEGGDDGA
jgi:DNA gyrase/topoisomerase IV subunit B